MDKQKLKNIIKVIDTQIEQIRKYQDQRDFDFFYGYVSAMYVCEILTLQESRAYEDTARGLLTRTKREALSK